MTRIPSMDSKNFIVQLSDRFPVLLNILLLLSTQKIGRDDEKIMGIKEIKVNCQEMKNRSE